MRCIVRGLRQSYPGAECALHHADPFQLLVATVLSAQCTDKRVNEVTPAPVCQIPNSGSHGGGRPVRNRATDPEYGVLPQQGSEPARSVASDRDRIRRQSAHGHGGSRATPRRRDARPPTSCWGLLSVYPPGWSSTRMSSAVSRRLGLTQHTAPVKIEQDLMKLLPRKEWIDYSHRVILHGRQICKARRPLCESCPLARLCPRVGVPSNLAG